MFIHHTWTPASRYEFWTVSTCKRHEKRQARELRSCARTGSTAGQMTARTATGDAVHTAVYAGTW
eukprot:6188485-Pleurochrysis_carterae.AAC.1